MAKPKKIKKTIEDTLAWAEAQDKKMTAKKKKDYVSSQDLGGDALNNLTHPAPAPMTHEITQGESSYTFSNDPAKMGRPTKYKVEFNQVVKSMSMRGAVDMDLCEALSISESTLSTWKQEHPNFLASIKEGKDLVDTMVEKSLLNRAIGCNIKEIKVHCTKEGDIVQTPIERHFPPDPTSMIFWLKNRKPKEWRDKHEVDFVSPLTIQMGDADQGTL